MSIVDNRTADFLQNLTFFPGLPNADARALDLPTLVFRSGESDAHHTREMSEAVAGALVLDEVARREQLEPGELERARAWGRRLASIPG